MIISGSKSQVIADFFYNNEIMYAHIKFLSIQKQNTFNHTC